MQAPTIDALQAEIEHLKSLAYRDELTGLLNRRGIKDVFSGFFREALYNKEHVNDPTGKRTGVIIKDFSVIYLDIDNFKSINDTHGHDEGDRVLKQVAGLLLRHVRDIDAVGRLGGEEFVIGLLGATEENACNKAKQIMEDIVATVRAGNDEVTGSLGTASLHHTSSTTLDELIECADKAMYEAKHNRGKNATVCFSELV